MILDEHTNICLHCGVDIYSVKNNAVPTWHHINTGRMGCRFGDGFTIYQATPGGSV